MKIRNLILVITAIGLIAGPASSLEARRKKHNNNTTQRDRNHNGRGARTAGFLAGGTATGVGVGLATHNAGWGLLGAFGGGVAGYFLVRAIQKGRKNRREREHKNREMKNNRNR